jgi:hypothetical protein
VRWDGGGRLGGEGELGAHRGYRNGAVMPADVRSSDEKFEQPGGSIRGEEGRERRGGHGVLIGVVLMAITREKSTGGGVLLRRPFPETEREGEDFGRRVMTSGVHCR